MNLVIVFVLLSVFAWWESFLLWFLAFSAPERKKAKILEYEAKAISAIFLMFKYYAGFRIDFKNLVDEDIPQRFLLVSNHQSLLDIPLLMYLIPGGKRARFVAKQELAWGIPLISLLLRKAGHSLVRRKGDALHAIRSVEQMARRCIKEGSIPVIFPEGHRSQTGILGTFHSAGYRKILEVESLPILVVALEGGRYVRTLKDFFRNFGTSPYSVRFVGLMPPPANKREALRSLENARLMIDEALLGMRRLHSGRN
ncbi:MAG: lysophospholipid acyltransferase family protein [Spirochaetes bacterium]|nr:lysophospholipid acyltransferase family protein [Spirochaetota bacterium]